MSTVLIVDDETNIRLFLRANLTARGFQVIEAASAEDGLTKLNTDTPPALAILDVLLPGVDGWQMAQRMAQDPALSRIPVIMLTASINPDAPEPPNIVAHLVKPVSIDVLMGAVREALRE